MMVKLKRVAKVMPAASTLAGFGAVVAMAPDAEAAIIQSSIANLAIPVTTAGVYFNVVSGVSATTPGGAPGWDLNLWGSSNLQFWGNNAAEPNDGVMAFPGGTSSLVGNLAPGTLVDGSRTFNRTGSQESGASGQFQLNAINYIGFRFLDSVAGTTHFGWASILIGTSFTNATRQVVSVYYEGTADTAIAVGDTGSNGVPEPSTALLLATGAAGVMALRRRRKTS
jgi:hypothetical protein